MASVVGCRYLFDVFACRDRRDDSAYHLEPIMAATSDNDQIAFWSPGIIAAAAAGRRNLGQSMLVRSTPARARLKALYHDPCGLDE